MKKGKEFKVGDKVFAKIKGYPAWPAIITEAHNAKIHVKFYGTGETGIVKPKDVFYYLKNKTTFAKFLKRKDYNDAIEQIEQAIKECGSDGNTEGTEEDTGDAAVLNEGGNKAVKRKRSITEKTHETQTKKKAVLQESTTEESEETDDTLSKLSSQDSKLSTNSTESLNRGSESVGKNQNDQEVSTNQEVAKENDITNTENGESTNSSFKIITDDYLRALVSYGEHVKNHEDLYKKKPPEQRQNKVQVVPIKLPDWQYLGILFDPDSPVYKTEFEQAEHEEVVANHTISLKTSLEDGTSKIEEISKLVATDFKMDEAQVQDAVEMDQIERKKAKLKWLRTESTLIELDGKIKMCLGLDKAEPRAALDHLNTILKMEVHPVMLKKRPHVVDVVKRLRRYIGNVKEWNMTDSEKMAFEFEAEKVREVADKIYLKFAKLFNVDESQFWDVFTEAVKEFKLKVKDLDDGLMSALTYEPNSRQAFLDKIDEEEEMKIIKKLGQAANKPQNLEKENSSTAANINNAKNAHEGSNESNVEAEIVQPA